MSYHEIIRAVSEDTAMLLQEDYKKEMTELRRLREIDLFLRGVVVDSELLDFLRARTNSAVLVKDSRLNNRVHKVILDARAREGRIFLPYQNDHGVLRGMFYSLISVPENCEDANRYRHFLGGRGLAFVCTSSNRNDTRLGIGELLCSFYAPKDGRFEGQTAESMEKTLINSLMTKSHARE